MATRNIAQAPMAEAAAAAIKTKTIREFFKFNFKH